MRTVLFLCTGNYYRSRFAEILFNDLACRSRLDWRAESRGLQLHDDNIGAISRHAVRGLLERGIELPQNPRHPLAVTLSDLQTADLVIALKEAEHRPLLDADFPGWSSQVELWNVDDLDAATPGNALSALEENLGRLVLRLQHLP